MPDTPFAELLGPEGPVRQAIHAHLGWGGWADVFCDELVARLAAQHVEDIVDKYGAHFVSYGSGDTVKLNVRWTQEQGFSCHTGATLNEALVDMWRQVELGSRFKPKV